MFGSGLGGVGVAETISVCCGEGWVVMMGFVYIYMCFGILVGFWRELDFEGILTERVACFPRPALKPSMISLLIP